MSVYSHFVNLLLGDLGELQDRPLEFFLRLRRERGGVAQFRAAHRRIALVTDPAGIEHVLKTRNANYGKRTRGFEQLRIALRNGLLTSEGDLWLRQRRIAQPAFHRDCIARFASVMVAETERHIAGWRPDTTIDLAHEMMELTLRIVGQTLFSSDLAADSTLIGDAVSIINHDLRERTFHLSSLPMAFPTPTNRRLRAVLARVDALIYRELDRRRGREGEFHDLLSMLMFARDENGELMSDDQLRDEFITMMVAGHETTANALAWTFTLLSQHAAAARELRAEVTAVCDGRAPSFADVASLKYTRAVVSEALRLYPPAWTIGRNAIADDVICGERVHAGTIVLLSPYVTHRDERYWPRPEAFDPERFVIEAPDRPRYAYFPFGGGPRQCIGSHFAMMEAQLIVATIAPRFELTLVDDTPPALEPLITLRPKGGLPMRVRYATRGNASNSVTQLRPLAFD